MSRTEIAEAAWAPIEPPGSPIEGKWDRKHRAVIERVRADAYSFCSEIMEVADMKVMPTVSVAWVGAGLPYLRLSPTPECPVLRALVDKKMSVWAKNTMRPLMLECQKPACQVDAPVVH